MTRNIESVRLALVLCLCILSSCNTFIFHNTTPPPHLAISEKGELAVNAFGSANPILGRDVQAYGSIGYSPIKHVVVQGSLGFDLSNRNEFSGIMISEGLALGLYYKWDIGPDSYFSIDAFGSNEQFFQSLDYFSGSLLKVKHQAWKAALGAHLNVKKYGIDYMFERVHVDFRKLNFEGTPIHNGVFSFSQNDLEAIQAVDDTAYHKLSLMLRRKLRKSEAYILISRTNSQTYIRSSAAYIGIRFSLGKD